MADQHWWNSKAVSDGYPLYGDLELQPQQPLIELLDEYSVVVQESLLRKLERSVGDEVFLNGIVLIIKANCSSRARPHECWNEFRTSGIDVGKRTRAILH